MRAGPAVGPGLLAAKASAGAPLALREALPEGYAFRAAIAAAMPRRFDAVHTRKAEDGEASVAPAGNVHAFRGHANRSKVSANKSNSSFL